MPRALAPLLALVALAGATHALVTPLAPTPARVELGVAHAPVLVEPRADGFLVRSASSAPVLVEVKLVEASQARHVDVLVDGAIHTLARRGVLVREAGEGVLLAAGTTMEVDVRLRGPEDARVLFDVEARPWAGGPVATRAWVVGAT